MLIGIPSGLASDFFSTSESSGDNCSFHAMPPLSRKGPLLRSGEAFLVPPRRALWGAPEKSPSSFPNFFSCPQVTSSGKEFLP